MGGGIVIVLGVILDWGPRTNGLNTDFNGLFGIVVLLIGIALVAVGGIKAFSPSTALPTNLGGFSLNQLTFAKALTVFLWTFALVGVDGAKIGLHLTWIGAAVAIAGTVLELRNSAGSTSPTTI